MNRPMYLRLNSGVILQGRQVWISELISIMFLSGVCVLFFVSGIKVMHNEYEIRHLNAMITKKRSQGIIVAEYHEQLNNKAAIAELLFSIAGKKLSEAIIIELAGIVYDNSTLFGYDPLLLLAVIDVESVFSPDAKGRYRDGSLSGALGLMQIKPETAGEVAAKLNMLPVSQSDLLQPEINIVLGVSYLTSMISKFKSFKLGLLAYNQGPAVISRHVKGESPLSVNYYRKVLGSYAKLKGKKAFLKKKEMPSAELK